MAICEIRGAVVSGLTNENSPAALAGLKLGDHILAVDTEAVRDLPHLMRLIGGSLAGIRYHAGTGATG